jgi:hypothetical protein
MKQFLTLSLSLSLSLSVLSRQNESDGILRELEGSRLEDPNGQGKRM